MQIRGKGLWKFNNELLKNKDFIDMIKEELFLIKSIYALPEWPAFHSTRKQYCTYLYYVC